MSPERGYPRAGASAAGRLALVDVPLVPDLVCMSSAREVMDFAVGFDADDAITRQCGDNTPRFRHAINAGDLLLFSDRGLYYINIRDGSVLTPSTFNVVLFDQRAASPVRPVAVQDGVVFVEGSGEAIAVALLDGNIYLKWSVKTISTYANHLIRTPIKLCGPSIDSVAPEKYMFVVNSDGTLAALTWFEQFDVKAVGFTLWDTQGFFMSISPIFGGYWAIVNRNIDGTVNKFLERFDDDLLIDCAQPVAVGSALYANGNALIANGERLTGKLGLQDAFQGETLHVVSGNGYYGTYAVDADGLLSSDLPASAMAGFNFESVVAAWAVELIQTERGGLVTARRVRGSVAMLSSGPFMVRANDSEKRFGGFVFGDDLENPILRTKDYGFMVLGRRDNAVIEIVKEQPAAFKVLAITVEVTG